MADPYLANILGAMALAIADDVEQVTSLAAGQGASIPAALVTIGYNSGRTIEALSQALSLTHSTTVRVVEKLVGLGWVERRPGNDKRSTSLFLTRAGKRKMEHILEERRRILLGVVNLLSKPERDQLRLIVEKVLAGMARSSRHAEQICRLCEDLACPLETCPVGFRD